jgi:hypothetical protein
MLWFSTGGSAPVHVTGVKRSGGCVASPKLTIEPISEPPSGLYDVVHSGLATTDRVPIEAVRRLLPADTEWRQIQPQIERIFRARERRVVDGYPGADVDMRQRLSAARMARFPVTVDWLYRATAEGPPIYYFEAAKRTPGSDSVLRIGVRGWLVSGRNGALASIGVNGQPHWDEGLPTSEISNVSDQIPLGILRVAGRAIWVVEVPTGETGTFVLYDVSVTGVRRLVVTDAGGC